MPFVALGFSLKSNFRLITLIPISVYKFRPRHDKMFRNFIDKHVHLYQVIEKEFPLLIGRTYRTLYTLPILTENLLNTKKAITIYLDMG